MGRTAAWAALASYLIVIWQTVVAQSLPRLTHWAEATLLIGAGMATFAALTRRLSWIKVLIGVIAIAIIGTAAHATGAATSMPFGPFTYTDEIGPRLWKVIAWPMTVLWLVAALNARGVARMILRPWRKTKRYGFWVIGLATVLLMAFVLALDPYASKVRTFWVWQPTRFNFTWFGMPWTNLWGWGLTALVAYAFATPFLVNKEARRRKQPPDYQPLIIWDLALLLFAVSAGIAGQWLVVAVSAGLAAVSSVAAIRGARW